MLQAALFHGEPFHWPKVMPLSSLEFMSFLKFFLLSSSFIELLLEKIYVMATMYSNSSAFLCFWLTFHTGSCCMSNASLQFEIFLPQLLSARVTGLHGHTRLWHVLCLTHDLSFFKKIHYIIYLCVCVYLCECQCPAKAQREHPVPRNCS